jgi:tRNA (guanine37-N1)-methyltransferase
MISSVRVDILTLFPEMCRGPLAESILKRGMQAGHLGVYLHQIRDYTYDRHHTVDDYPYGGGAGMVMKAPPLVEALETVLALPPGPPGLYAWHKDGPPEVWVAPDEEVRSAETRRVPLAGCGVRSDDEGLAEAENTQHATRNTENAERRTQNSELAPTPVILMSPAGRVFTQAVAAELAALPRFVLVCGHYEGVDERVRAGWITDELSIGDYVLTGGELAALVVVDAVARLVPGVLAEGSAGDESHSAGLLEYPQYTRPPEFRGRGVPPILLGGHHAKIAEWRRREALRTTWQRRPDLLAGRPWTPQERRWLAEFQAAEDREEQING